MVTARIVPGGPAAASVTGRGSAAYAARDSSQPSALG